MWDTLKEMFKSLKMEFSPKCLGRSSVLEKKPRLVAWIIFNFVMIWFGNTYDKMLIALAFCISILYLLLLFIALSSLPEKIVRLFEDARRVATQTEKDRLTPIFNEVYEKVKRHSKAGKKIRLYIVDQMNINAFAVGKNTIVISRGIISTMSDQEIKGILAHEFAHIVYGDTQVTMLITIATNFYIMFALLIAKCLSFIENLVGANSFVGSLARFVRTLIEMVVEWFLWVITLLVSTSSRKMEYIADKYASDIGYKEQLISALYKLYDMQVSDKKKLVEQIKASHPKIAYRIERLEKMA
jgi:heat shock protein HtpX